MKTKTEGVTILTPEEWIRICREHLSPTERLEVATANPQKLADYLNLHARTVGGYLTAREAALDILRAARSSAVGSA